MVSLHRVDDGEKLSGAGDDGAFGVGAARNSVVEGLETRAGIDDAKGCVERLAYPWSAAANATPAMSSAAVVVAGRKAG